MKKILLLSCLFIAFFSCKKDKTRKVSGYGQAIDSMQLSYNHTYLFFFQRTATAGGATITDSDRIIFLPNGTITEVSKRFDSASYTFPDSINFPVNTSFDNNINWNQIPQALVFAFNPIHDSVRGYLFHDYLNTDIVTIFRSHANSATDPNHILVTHALPDSTSYVTGYIKK